MLLPALRSQVSDTSDDTQPVCDILVRGYQQIRPVWVLGLICSGFPDTCFIVFKSHGLIKWLAGKSFLANAHLSFPPILPQVRGALSQALGSVIPDSPNFASLALVLFLELENTFLFSTSVGQDDSQDPVVDFKIYSLQQLAHSSSLPVTKIRTQWIFMG